MTSRLVAVAYGKNESESSMGMSEFYCFWSWNCIYLKL